MAANIHIVISCIYTTIFWAQIITCNTVISISTMQKDKNKKADPQKLESIFWLGTCHDLNTATIPKSIKRSFHMKDLYIQASHQLYCIFNQTNLKLFRSLRSCIKGGELVIVNYQTGLSRYTNSYCVCVIYLQVCVAYVFFLLPSLSQLQHIFSVCQFCLCMSTSSLPFLSHKAPVLVLSLLRSLEIPGASLISASSHQDTVWMLTLKHTPCLLDLSQCEAFMITL